MTRKRNFLPIAEQNRYRRTVTVKQADDPSIVIFTYTLTTTYLGTYTSLIGNPPGAITMQPVGSVLALWPDTLTVVPHFTSYGWEPVGVLAHDAIMDWVDEAGAMEVAVIVRGDVYEALCWDNGDYGVVLAETKAALGDRVKFV